MQSLWLDRPQHAERGGVQAFPASTRYDVVVVGAGLTGLTNALLLARSGLSVAVLEARTVGAGTTGNTTAKLSVLQGSRLSKVLKHRSLATARAYVDANREGRDWLLRYCAEHGVDVQRRDAVSYATTEEGAAAVRREHRAAIRLGLPVTLDGAEELPFATTAAVRLADQAQFDPMDVLAALAADLRAHGGTIHEGVRVTRARVRSDGVELRTGRGVVSAARVVLATGAPVLDRGLYFAKLTAQRSYALAYRVPGEVPEGMYLSLDSPSRSLRTTPVDGEQRLLVGGNGHVVGRSDSERAAVDDLEAWTQRHFPGAERTHAWSSQDYEPISAVPYVGRLPRGRGRIFVATGYDKWGMSNAVAAALALTELMLGGHMTWAHTLYRHGLSTADVGSLLGAGAAVGAELVKGYAGAWMRRPAQAHEGEGLVTRGEGAGLQALRPVGRCVVDGDAHTVSAVCPHLGGVLAWNDAERSWDCPLHGSRFTAAGVRLEGPALHNLPAAR